MTRDLIAGLRQAIDAKHEEALTALGTLKGYLDAAVLPNGQRTAKKKVGRKKQLTAGGSIRDLVIAAFNEPRTVISAADELGLTKKQVRGVIGSPDLRSQFVNCGEVEGVMTYKFTEEKPAKT